MASKTLLLVAGASVAAYFVLGKKSDSPATGPSAADLAAQAAIQGGQLGPVPATSSAPPSVTPSVPASARFVDRFGVPHVDQAGADRWNQNMTDSDGVLWRGLSDFYHLFCEDIEKALGYDVERSGNSWDVAKSYFRADYNRFADALLKYNQAHPNTPLAPRW